MTPPQEKVTRWLLSFIADAEALREQLQEHLQALSRLEASPRPPSAPDGGPPPTTPDLRPPPPPPLPPRKADPAPQKPLPDLETMQDRHALILQKLGGLGTTGDAGAWRSAAQVAQQRIQKWLGAYTRLSPDDPDGIGVQMAARVKALQSGSALVQDIPALAVRLDQDMAHISTQQQALNPRSGLGNLADTDTDLKNARLQITQTRDALRDLAKQAGEPPMFAALLGRTSSLLQTVDAAEDALDAAATQLKHAIADEARRDELSDLGTVIDRDLSQLSGRGEPATWLKEQEQLAQHLQRWLDLNGKLHTALDASRRRAERATLSRAAPVVQQIDGLEGRLDALAGALRALPSDEGDVAAVRALRLRNEALVSDILDVRAALQGMSGALSGPPLFQGLLSALNGWETHAQSLLQRAEGAEQDAQRQARATLDDDALRTTLTQTLQAEQATYGKALQAEARPAAWLMIGNSAERTLRRWLDQAADLPEPLPSADSVEAIVEVLNQAQSLLPRIQDVEQEFERRRTIDFARVSADPQEALVLHAALERLSSLLRPALHELEALQKRALSVGGAWNLFAALVSQVQDQQLMLADFEDRLYRMYYNQESGAPDAKTTSEGGTINLSPEEEDAAKQLVQRRIQSYLLEENRRRHLQGEEPLTTRDIPEETIDQFRRIARRMVVGHTSRYS